ncbi:MAG: ABC transporter permease [Bryobacterales bacterium]|nr:ABC transporter permease [Bryobacterales bacterium]
MYLRDAFRFLKQSPAFTAGVLLILAAGIGANAAIFSFVSALLLRPMPFPEPERLVRIESVHAGVNGKLMPREWEELDRDQATFEGVAAWYPSQYNLSADGRPEVVRACMTTANLFRVLGVPLALGSSWEEGTHRQRNPSIVLSHELWSKRLGASPGIVRQTLALDGSPYLVVGVSEPGFQFPVRSDVYRAASLGGAQNDNVRGLFVVGRLRRGLTLQQAQSRLDAFAAAMASQYPDSNRDIRFRVQSLREAYVGEIRPYVLLTFALSAIVLSIACVNVVSLLVARGLSRRREMAIRVAMGAGSGQIVRQLLAESVLLNLVGGGLGLAVAAGAIGSLRTLLLADLPPWMDVRLDAGVLLFTLAMSVVCGIAAGLYPAWQASRTDPQIALREGTRGAGGGRTQGLIRQGLITGEVALAVVLLIAAGLLVRSFASLRDSNAGFARSQLLAFRTDPPWFRYSKVEQTAVFYRQAQERLEQIPGVAAVAANHSLPLALNQNYGKPSIVVDGQGVEEQRGNPFVNPQIVSPNYFGVMGIPLVEGRGFTGDDRITTQPVAVLSRPLAQRLFGGGGLATGRRVRLPEVLGSLDSKQLQWFTVVGVVEGVRSESLTGAPGMDIYLSNQQQFAGDTFFVMRTALAKDVVVRQAAEAIRAVDVEQPIFAVQSVEELVEETVWQRRIAGQLSACFGGLAALLAATGIYSLLSWTVSQRRRELAIRQALGASPGEIRRLVVGEGLRVAGVGLLIGGAVALPVAQSVAGLLFGVKPWDAVSIGFAMVFVALFTLLASGVPALRASRVSPNDALKAD